MNTTLLISLTCLCLSVCSWLVLVIVVMFFPGGHPPLAAYFELPVIVLTVPLGALGLVMGIKQRKASELSSWSDEAVIFGNALMVVLGPVVLVWQMWFW